ncbi:hypothetical protein AB1Y20_019798 [Prymnesium parvum]|uniref:Uncharacterized protein n=1 Tax=Prymnesium parvum TaxID=97485 RepID=A0AB34JVE4_PRYPA
MPSARSSSGSQSHATRSSFAYGSSIPAEPEAAPAHAPKPAHWTLEPRTHMGNIVGGAAAEAAPRRIQRFQHFSPDRDPVTVQLGGGRQRTDRLPREPHRPPEPSLSSVYVVDSRSVVQEVPPSPVSAIFFDPEEDADGAEFSVSACGRSEMLTLDTTSNEHGLPSQHTAYTVSGLGSREMSELSLSRSGTAPFGFSETEQDGAQAVHGHTADRRQPPWDAQEWQAGIKARGRDGMGALLRPTSQRGTSSGESTRTTTPAVAPKEGYMGHQPKLVTVYHRLLHPSNSHLRKRHQTRQDSLVHG